MREFVRRTPNCIGVREQFVTVVLAIDHQSQTQERSTLHHDAPHFSTLQQSAVHCNTLQYTALHYNTPHYSVLISSFPGPNSLKKRTFSSFKKVLNRQDTTDILQSHFGRSLLDTTKGILREKITKINAE